MNRTAYCYEYEKLYEMKGELPIESFIRYRFDVPCSNSSSKLSYLLDFMKVNDLWITDVYPQKWENDTNKCKRFTSHEGEVVDFRKIANTSVAIFIDNFNNTDDVMVISGSYEESEKQQGASRKLKLYKYFFTKLQQILPFRMIDDFANNSFYITQSESKIADNDIKTLYAEFKYNR